MRKINEEKKAVVDYDDGITRIYPDEKDDVKVKKSSKRKNSKKDKKAPFANNILILTVAVILLLVFLIANGSSGGFVSTVNGKMVAALTKNSTQAFDYSVDAESVYSFSDYNDGFVILTGNGIEFVDSNGKMISRQQYSYGNPGLEQRNNRFMVYNRGDSTYSLMQNTSLYSQQSVNEDIINAAISSKNNYVIAVKRDNNAKSILYGFSGNGKLIYQWNCSIGYIADVAMNDSGSKAAVTVVDAVNAVLCSTVYVLDFEYDTEYAKFDYPDETVLGTKFLSNKKIQVITDKRVYLISSKKQEVVYEFDSSDICYTNIEDGAYTAVVTKSYTLEDSYILSIFNKFGKLKTSVELSGEVCGLDSSGKSIAVLFKDKTETYSSNGKLVGTVTGLHLNEDIIINGNYLYVLSSDSVKKYAAYGNSEAVYDYEDSAQEDEDLYYNEDYAENPEEETL